MFWILAMVLFIVILVAVFRLVRSQGNKMIKIIVGTLGTLFAIAQFVSLLAMVPKGTDSAYQWGRLMGAILGTVYGGVISFACFKSAFTKGKNRRTS
ncbi:MAG: hypothetical protein ACYSSP_13925 [Planctomycetota bacterium]|jgi:hypothetical protein